MCQHECDGDFYRGCQHYVVKYFTGNVEDCNDPNCRTSSTHRHRTARDCGCAENKTFKKKVTNMFQFKCDTCMEAARSRNYR